MASASSAVASRYRIAACSQHLGWRLVDFRREGSRRDELLVDGAGVRARRHTQLVAQRVAQAAVDAERLRRVALGRERLHEAPVPALAQRRELDPPAAGADRRHQERFAGGSVANFFRKPFGPGWALVGDAGYDRDPITAQGISDAFRDAELCVTALDESLTGSRAFEAAMADYQQTRDEQVRPMYEFTTQLATLEPPPPEMQQLLGAAQGNQEAMDQFVSVVAGTVSPAEFLSPENIGRIMSTAGAAAAS